MAGMTDPYDPSFIDAETVAAQREHRRRLEMLCLGTKCFETIGVGIATDRPFLADADQFPQFEGHGFWIRFAMSLTLSDRPRISARSRRD